MSEHAHDPAAIEADLHATRARLDTRLSDLANRLSPGQVIDEALDFLKTRQGVDFSRNLTDSVRERPFPVALVGIGLAWLMAGPRPAYERESRTVREYVGPRIGARSPRDDLATRVSAAGRGVLRRTGEDDNDYRSRVDRARGEVLGLTRDASETGQAFADRIQQGLFATRDGIAASAEGVSDRLRDAGGRASGAVHDASDRIGARMHDLRDQGARLGEAAAEGSRRAADRTSSMMTAIAGNPVLLGALGVTAGALLGVLLPPTELEQEYLGDSAAEARGAVRGVMQEAAQRGSELAEAAMEAGRKTAHEAGDALRQTGEEAAGAAREVGETARQGASAATEKAAPASARADGDGRAAP